MITNFLEILRVFESFMKYVAFLIFKIPKKVLMNFDQNLVREISCAKPKVPEKFSRIFNHQSFNNQHF